MICQSCDWEIEFGITAKGRRIPIDVFGRHDAGERSRLANLAVVGTFANGTLAVDVVEPGEGERVRHNCKSSARRRR